jgi:large subunit ribosomal protein L15
MTSKKRRQRGSRTHGGGTHKNRRGAGNRGGRGNAGRSKHQMHGQPPLGKHGFTRPSEVTREVREIDVRTIDEQAPLWAEDGRVEETDFGYRVDARDVVEDGRDADVVKVLGTGQVRNQLEVTADAFSARAVELIEGEGGDAVLTERGEALAVAADEAASDESEEVREPDDEA